MIEKKHAKGQDEDMAKALLYENQKLAEKAGKADSGAKAEAYQNTLNAWKFARAGEREKALKLMEKAVETYEKKVSDFTSPHEKSEFYKNNRKLLEYVKSRSGGRYRPLIEKLEKLLSDK
jgi:hypothetical protein